MAATKTGPFMIVGTTGADVALRVSSSSADDSNIQSASTRNILTCDGDLITQNMGGFKVALGPWVETNIATSITTATAQLLSEVAGMAEISMPYAGSIVGISAAFSANITASTCRVCVSKNGTTVFSAINSATGVRVISGTQNKDVDTFVVGDRLGVKLVTTATFAPTTLEGVFTVWVEV